MHFSPHTLKTNNGRMITHKYVKGQVFCLKLKVALVEALRCIRTVNTQTFLPQEGKWRVVLSYPVRI